MKNTSAFSNSKVGFTLGAMCLYSLNKKLKSSFEQKIFLQYFVAVKTLLFATVAFTQRYCCNLTEWIPVKARKSFPVKIRMSCASELIYLRSFFRIMVFFFRLSSWLDMILLLWYSRYNP